MVWGTRGFVTASTRSGEHSVSQTKTPHDIVASASADSIHTHPRFNNYAFRTEYVETARLETHLKNSPGHLLGIVHHGQIPGGLSDFDACPTICLDLPQFMARPVAEVWTSTLPVTYHQTDGIYCAMNEEVLFGAVQIEELEGTRLDIVAYNAYHRLLVQARALGYMHLLRMWNYFPHINRESDGRERYQQFCVGRHRALAESLSDFPRSCLDHSISISWRQNNRQLILRIRDRCAHTSILLPMVRAAPPSQEPSCDPRLPAHISSSPAQRAWSVIGVSISVNRINRSWRSSTT
jgi:hypothetical protein